MLSLAKTLKCFCDILHIQRCIIHNVSELKKTTISTINVSIFNELQSKLSSAEKSTHVKHVSKMPKEKKVKLTWLKVSKKLVIENKHSIFKSSPKRTKKRSKLISIDDETSGPSANDSVSEPIKSSIKTLPQESDIDIVYECIKTRTKAAVDVVTIDSDESQKSDNLEVNKMGNIGSDTHGTTVWATDSTWTSEVKSGTSWYCSASNWAQEYHDVRSMCPALFASERSDSPEATTTEGHFQAPERVKLRSTRRWEFTEFGLSVAGFPKVTPHHLILSVMSYNVLAQDLLESHTFLYKEQHPDVLTWEYRSQLLLDEIKEANVEILCLQEVQKSHIASFYNQLNDLGYAGVYKQRTGNNVDGVAIYYKKDIFQLVDHTSVEYYQPGVDLLDRHNVGLVVKLSPKAMPSEHIVVATTHLLFNQRRHDVKLAQMLLLLTEVERFAFKEFRSGEPSYWPVIITGDMNFEPYTGVYELLTKGTLQYEGLCSKTLSGFRTGQVLHKKFLPKYLGILDTCQHWGILRKRLTEKMDHKTELKVLKLYNTDHQEIKKKWKIKSEDNESSSVGPRAGYATGQLTHQLNLQSVYTHGMHMGADYEVTTRQTDWITVDYIFYSCTGKKIGDMRDEGKLKLVSKYRLPTVYEAEFIGCIPNLVSPSDHYPLLATFIYNF